MGSSPSRRNDGAIEFIPYDAVSGVREFERLNRAVEAAKLKVPIAEAFALARANKAHERLAEGHVLGKMVLRTPTVMIAQRPIDRTVPPTHVMGIARFERFFRAAAGLDVDKEDLKRYADFINRKIHDLLIRGEAVAKANGRDLIQPIDLPITKGMQENVHRFKEIDETIELRPIWIISLPDPRLIWISARRPRPSFTPSAAD